MCGRSRSANVENLQHLVLRTHQLSKADNPICNIRSYERVVRDAIPHVVSLDGFDAAGNAIENDTILSQYGDLLEDSTLVEYDFLVVLYAVGNPSLVKSRSRDKTNEIILDRVNELERKLASSQSNAVQPPVQPAAEPSPSLPNLEGQIARLVEVLVSNTQNRPVSEPAKSPPPAVVKQEATGKEVVEQSERLKAIEEQMKELLQLSINNEKIVIQKGGSEKSYKRQKAAVKMLEKELFGPHSPSSSEEFVTIPTKVPKDAKNRSLVWVEEEPEKENVPHKANRPNSPVKKTVKLGSRGKDHEKSAKDLANDKLISALEAEERRLRDNEFRYAEKIKSLTSQLDTEKTNGKKALELLKQVEALRSSNEALKRDLGIATAAKDSQADKIAEFTIELAKARHETAQLKVHASF
ncbi:hypothetical protein HDU91_000991 [Kappamyces sp. JEL0680]|nr:hypothetical protein HDU91_000991 [Kappamyces sp. JEL0680]